MTLGSEEDFVPRRNYGMNRNLNLSHEGHIEVKEKNPRSEEILSLIICKVTGSDGDRVTEVTPF